MFSDARNMFVYLLLRTTCDRRAHFFVQIPNCLQGYEATQLVDK
jgi:hypothetical protein